MPHLIRRREPIDPLSSFGRLDPIQAMRDFFRGDPMAEIERWLPNALTPSIERPFAPKIEVKETKDAYVVKADLPGVRDEDVDLEIAGNCLTLRGKREEAEEEEGERYYVYERSYGSFSRTFTMPEGCNLEGAQAELTDGVLHVTVPKLPGIHARKVPIGCAKAGPSVQLGQEAAPVDTTEHKPSKAA